MDKDTIKRLIIEYQQFVANITLIEREIHLSHQLICAVCPLVGEYEPGNPI